MKRINYIVFVLQFLISSAARARTFLGMKLTKTYYIKNSVSDERLSNLAVLFTHRGII